MREIKAIGFDLDGTVLDTRVDYDRLNDADREVLDRHGIPFDDVFGPDPPARRRRAPIRDWLDSVGRGDEFRDIDGEIDDLCTFYETQFIDSARGFPGTAECIDSLRSMGYRTGLLTRGSREYADRVLPRFGLHDRMDAIVGRDYTWFDDAKPSPMAMIHFAGELGVEPDEILYVGDSITDYLPCRDVGAVFVGVLTGSMDRAGWESAGVVHMIDRVGDLADAIPGILDSL